MSIGDRNRNLSSVAAHGRVYAAAVVAIGGAALLLLPGLGQVQLQGDEAMYGSVALDSAAAGRWLTLELDGKPYVNKPPLLFWLLRGSFRLFGASAESARLPCALAGMALVLWMLRAGAQRSGAWIGALAGLLVVSTPTALGLAGDRGFRNVSTDSVLVLAVAVAIGAWLRWERGGRLESLVGSAAAAGAGGLAKGYLAPLFLVLGLLAGAWHRPAIPASAARRRNWWLAAGLVVGAGIATMSLWLGALETAGAPRLWQRVVLRNSIDRWTNAVDPSHLQGPSYYPRTLGEDFGFWLLLLVPATIALWRTGRTGSSSRVRPLALDLILPLLTLAVFSTAATKLRWYLMPAYPFLALAIAAGALEVWKQLRLPSLRIGLTAILGVSLVLRLGGALASLEARQLPAQAPLIQMLESEEGRALRKLYIDSALGFGAPAGGLTAEEYFFLGSQSKAIRALPDSIPSGEGCFGFLSGNVARLASVAGLATIPAMRIERSRADVGPLWLVIECSSIS